MNNNIYLNKKEFLKIKKSEISGKGVFAVKKILKGQTICFLKGEICSLKQIIKRIKTGQENSSDPLQIDKEKYIDLDELSRTFNHSCNPNSYIKGKNQLIALKNIKAEQEITYDYSTTMDDNEIKINRAGIPLWTSKCFCGEKNCRKIIDQFKTLPKKRQNYYIKNRLMPDFMLKKFKT